MRTKGKFFALVLVLVCALSVTPRAALAAEGHIGMEAAKKIALDHAGAAANSVTFTKVKLDYDHGMAEYEIKFISNEVRHDYEIDANSGEITSYSRKAQKVRRQDREAAAQNGYIGIDRAKAIALEHAGVSAEQAHFTKAKLDRERSKRRRNGGRAEYEIEFYVNGTEHEFEISASDGKILEYSVETRY